MLESDAPKADPVPGLPGGKCLHNHLILSHLSHTQHALYYISALPMPPEELSNNFFNLPPPVNMMPPRLRPPPGYRPGPPLVPGVPPMGKQWLKLESLELSVLVRCHNHDCVVGAPPMVGFQPHAPPPGTRPMMPPRPIMHYPSQDPTRMGATQNRGNVSQQ